MTPYLNSRPRFACSLYNLYGATMTIKGSLQMSIPIVKDPLMRNFLLGQKLAENLRFCGKV